MLLLTQEPARHKLISSEQASIIEHKYTSACTRRSSSRSAPLQFELQVSAMACTVDTLKIVAGSPDSGAVVSVAGIAVGICATLGAAALPDGPPVVVEACPSAAGLAETEVRLDTVMLPAISSPSSTVAPSSVALYAETSWLRAAMSRSAPPPVPFKKNSVEASRVKWEAFAAPCSAPAGATAQICAKLVVNAAPVLLSTHEPARHRLISSEQATTIEHRYTSASAWRLSSRSVVLQPAVQVIVIACSVGTLSVVAATFPSGTVVPQAGSVVGTGAALGACENPDSSAVEAVAEVCCV